jgi:surface polysaccharide O-acyltransferase-like enzyme
MKKIPSLDLARGFTVLLFAPVHSVLLYSTPAVKASFLGALLGWLAEGPGAELFMLLMGLFFAFGTEHKSFLSVCQRAFTLLILAYALNVLKFVLPLKLHLLSAGLLNELGVRDNEGGVLSAFLMGDILHFAALALPILWLVTRLPNYAGQAILLALLVACLSPICWDLHSANPFVNYLLTLAGGQPPQVFFPILPWLVYPLTGLAIGYYLKKAPAFVVFWIMACAGIILLMVSTCFPPDSVPEPFYRTGPAHTFYHLGIVLVWLYVCYWISCHVARTWFVRLLGYLSRNITQVYVIQWVVICWLVPAFGYGDLGLIASLGCMVLTTGITLWLSITFNLLRPRRGRRP